jgi:hypothetical protein
MDIIDFNRKTMMVSIIVGLLVASILAVTFYMTSPPYCGESFCLLDKPNSRSRTTPAEDFNLYRFQSYGKKFIVYEGNYPNTTGETGLGAIPAIPTGFVDGELYANDIGYSVVLRTPNAEWPMYIAVSVESKDIASMGRFLSALRARPGKNASCFGALCVTWIGR